MKEKLMSQIKDTILSRASIAKAGKTFELSCQICSLYGSPSCLTTLLFPITACFKILGDSNIVTEIKDADALKDDLEIIVRIYRTHT